MPKRTRRRHDDTDADVVECFLWGDGTYHVLGEPCFTNEADAASAWRRVRRAVWAVTPRFVLPHAAVTFDGLTMTAQAYILMHWNTLPPFTVRAALACLADDRAHVTRFEAVDPKGAQSIADYLALLKRDFDVIAAAADALGGQPWLQREYPLHITPAATNYGLDEPTPLIGDEEDV